MSSRASLHPAPEASSASPEDLRVRLEGAWEVLEQARDHKSALLKRLDSFRWKHHLQRDPVLPRRVRELEAPLAQALERVEHRLHQESWPESHPLHRLVRQLHALKTRLDKRVRQRLSLWEPGGEWTFEEGLVRLEARVREPRHQLPGEAEPVLMTGGADFTWGSSVSGFLSLLWILPARALALGYSGYLVSGFLILVGFPLLLRLLRQRTRFWLTPRRLVWRTRRGQVRQLALDSLRYAFALPFVSRDGVVVRQEGGPRTLLAGMENLPALRTVLALRELSPLHGQTLSAPTYALAMFPAVRGERPSKFRWLASSGVLVMRPGQFVFLEDKHLWNIVREVCHRVTDALYGLSLSTFLQQLQLLPEAEFDRCLEAAIRAGGGSCWPSSAVTHGITASDEYQVRLPDGTVLTGTPDPTQHEAISRILQLGGARS
ncbi:hypothetical protein F0U61_31770 [Archangium violaceum]|uniref:hypothetical protein n=1 Tax=Archangium violaceum TaxID=83451 RepID=UPI002B2EA9CD|nr:hypothetical protein F0U61_31770 [Archangium violaceum]